jgi:hypothetical protein
LKDEQIDTQKNHENQLRRNAVSDGQVAFQLPADK